MSDTAAKVKLIWFEPLLGRISRVDRKEIYWVVVGGESGLKVRHMYPSWVEAIRDL